MVDPGQLCVQVAGDSVAGTHRREPAVSHPAAAGDCRRGSLAIRHSPRLSRHSVPVALSCDPSLHRDDGLGGRIALALCRHPDHARADPDPDDALRFLAGGVGRLSRVRVLPRHVLPHRLSTADDLAGAVLRDRALSPLASRGGSERGGCQLRHPPAVHRSLFGTHYLPKDAWPQRYGLVGGSVPRGFFAQLLAPFKRDAA